ncbi:trigger factor [Niveibacterium sp. SC-1]|uniref:trigger factor n=1 Tax=Niveibacterium sp. SC-1 TaxID=3135646 RepID=UPI00311FC250
MTNEVTLGALERRIDMSVALADIEREVDSRLKKMARTVKMPGFRPGKVPMKMVEQTYGAQARNEALGAAVERAFGEQVRSQNLRVAGYPRIEPKEGSAEGSLAFSAVFEIYPEITPADLSGKSLERPALEVNETEIDRTIEILRKQRTVFEIAARAAETGDKVTIDFNGTLGGEPFAGGNATDFPVVLGAGALLPEFESNVAGLNVGESKTFDLTFPEDYQASDMAGKTVQFAVTVKKIEAPRLPEVDADFARSLGVADGDVAKMREEVAANLRREVTRRVKAAVKDQAMNLLLEANPLEVPKALIEAESTQLAENARQEMTQRGMDASKMPFEPKWFEDQAVRRVKLGLLLAEVVKQNELQAKPEQIRALVDDYAQSFEEPAEVVKWYYSQPQRLAQAEAIVIEDNVVEWVLRNASVTDKAVAFDEFMGHTNR